VAAKYPDLNVVVNNAGIMRGENILEPASQKIAEEHADPAPRERGKRQIRSLCGIQWQLCRCAAHALRSEGAAKLSGAFGPGVTAIPAEPSLPSS
jgi:NAD(P)-dependent dehydrogenase (short-subunit alcohol dehydrogenase family)